MRVCYLDYETFWSVDHTLSKMNPITYVMHPETEIQSVSIAFDDWPIDVIFGEDNIRHAFSKIEWDDTMVVAHNNSGFDALISAWRFGIKPKAWGCTLAMARPFYALTVGGSLKKLSEAMGLADKFGAKGSIDAVNTKGKKLKDFTPDELARMKVYNKQDTLLCREIFKELAPKLSMHEMKLIDKSIRMTVEPLFEADIPLLTTALEKEMERKKLALLKLASLTGHYKEHMTSDQAAEAMKSVIMSQPQFAALLTQIGAEVPMKPSATTMDEYGSPKMIPALAKSDQGMTDLLEYEDPDGDGEREELVRVAAGTRLDVKSTQLETRLKTYINVGTCLGGKLPMPVNYCGAAISWRMSGGMKMNCMTGDHEVLTSGGWQRIDEWKPGTPIMQWWPNGTLQWDCEAKKVEQEADKIVHFDGPAVRGAFTPDHRMVSVRNGNVVERTARWVSEHSGLDNMPIAGMFDMEAGGDLTPPMVRLLVATAADAHAKNGAFVYGFKKQRKVERLLMLLEVLDVRYTKNVYDDLTVIRVGKFDAPVWLKKGFDSWVLHIGAAGMDALLDELVHWDGHANSKSGQTTFFTTDMKQAEWVATVGHLRGRSASVYEYPRAEGHKSAIHVYFKTSRYTSIDTKRHVKVVEGKTKVYCPQVESSYVLVRYEGSIYVTGNCQNMPRVDEKKPKLSDALRQSLVAPQGKIIVAVDSSNIELRVAHALAGQTDTVDKLRNKEDLYCWFATSLFGRVITKQDKDERFIGKVAMLSLQYGASWKAFQRMARVLSGGVTLLSDEECKRIVNLWRSMFKKIADRKEGFWNKCDTAIERMFTGEMHPVDELGLCFTTHGKIMTPNHHWLQYPDLRQNLNSAGKTEWLYGQGQNKSRIYGAHLFENLCQHIARLIVMEQTLKVDKEFPVALTCHDEAVMVVDEHLADDCEAYAVECFSASPKWWPDLPLAAEAGVGYTYAEAK